MGEGEGGRLRCSFLVNVEENQAPFYTAGCEAWRRIHTYMRNFQIFTQTMNWSSNVL